MNEVATALVLTEGERQARAWLQKGVGWTDEYELETLLDGIVGAALNATPEARVVLATVALVLIPDEPASARLRVERANLWRLRSSLEPREGRNG